MGKYQKFQQDKPRQQVVVHPVWRGIGFLLIVLVPLMAWAAANITLDYGLKAGWPIPADLLGPPTMRMPAIAYRVQVFVQIANWVGTLNNFNILGIFWLFYVTVFSAIMSLIYAVVYRMFGPPRYSAVDAPPSNRRARRAR
jgi:hypothetical protein